MAPMQIDVAGRLVRLTGESNAIAVATLGALKAGGAADAGSALPDILLAATPLLPDEDTDLTPLLREADDTASAMAARGHGRIIFITSAIATMPMRRYPRYSVSMATVLTATRTLAMTHGPHVLVNAVGVGAVEKGMTDENATGATLVSGDTAMPGHAGIRRAGTIAEAVAVALFFCDPLNTYTTGQILSADGGWQAGYGRSF